LECDAASKSPTHGTFESDEADKIGRRPAHPDYQTKQTMKLLFAHLLFAVAAHGHMIRVLDGHLSSNETMTTNMTEGNTTESNMTAMPILENATMAPNNDNMTMDTEEPIEVAEYYLDKFQVFMTTTVNANESAIAQVMADVLSSAMGDAFSSFLGLALDASFADVLVETIEPDEEMDAMNMTNATEIESNMTTVNETMPMINMTMRAGHLSNETKLIVGSFSGTAYFEGPVPDGVREAQMAVLGDLQGLNEAFEGVATIDGVEIPDLDEPALNDDDDDEVDVVTEEDDEDEEDDDDEEDDEEETEETAAPTPLVEATSAVGSLLVVGGLLVNLL